MADITEAPEWTVRKLLRAARQGVLATQAEGQPFAALVTPAVAADASILLLLSDLSEHTRQLRADPRCALLVQGDAAEDNPQTAPRVTVLGEALLDDSREARARHLAVHPYSALYADFGDFHLWRVAIGSAAFVGGFASAFRVAGDAIRPDPLAAAAIAEASEGIMAHCNADHADTMALLARAEMARMTGVDTDGCDLAVGDATRRVCWPNPVSSADDIRRDLIWLARAARA